MAREAFVVGVTNSRLNAAKRGIAVEIGARLAVATAEPICLVGADPTDRDVERHLPDLVVAWGQPSRMELTRGPHHLDVANFADAHVCVVSVSDRESIELVLPALLERFRFVIVDAPSRAGSGVGIADVLFDWIDALVVATGLNAGELAETRQYVEHVGTRADARKLDLRVLTIGDPAESGLAASQLDSRLALLPTIGHLPRMGARTQSGAIDGEELDDAFRPVIRWIVDGTARRRASSPPPEVLAEPTAPEQHVANALYRATMSYRGSIGSLNEE